MSADQTRFPIGHLPRLVASELRLMLSRKRNLFGLAVLGVVPVIIAIALKATDDDGGGLLGGLANGTTIPMAALLMESAFFLPLAIAMLAGDQIAGEANAGTLRYLLLVPVRRTTLLAVKFCSLVIGSLIGVTVITAVGLAIGTALFGTKPGLTLSGGSLTYAEGIGRLLLMALFIAAMLCGFAAIGLFFSTLVDHPMAVTVSLMVVVILSWILESVSQLGWLHPWLLTHWLTSFADLLRDPPLWTNVERGLALAATYVVVFGLAAWARFTSKDVTS